MNPNLDHDPKSVTESTFGDAKNQGLFLLANIIEYRLSVLKVHQNNLASSEPGQPVVESLGLVPFRNDRSGLRDRRLVDRD